MQLFIVKALSTQRVSMIPATEYYQTQGDREFTNLHKILKHRAHFEVSTVCTYKITRIRGQTFAHVIILEM